MTCREAERLVMPYINGSITDEELKAYNTWKENQKTQQEKDNDKIKELETNNGTLLEDSRSV